MKRANAHERDAHAGFAEGAAGCGHTPTFNPAVSAKQQRMMGADLARARAGKRTRTGMSKTQLREFAHKPRGGY